MRHAYARQIKRIIVFGVGFVIGDLIIGAVLSRIANRIVRGQQSTIWDTAARQSASQCERDHEAPDGHEGERWQNDCWPTEDR